ncbi:MgtC/SapB family protein [Streptobacillus felis]|uniref:MgtC/SapB family protein n=2 Tax=Streptobacillus felis TaxID=1384509 RepID=A0A7Z0T892_9FUSO|nr:MgtC/SapB family protein [Streptobacillus felis]
MTSMQNAIFLARILVACVCGAAIGYERTSKNKGAGVRTHAIVAVSSALMMIVSKYGFEDSIKFDASRVAAQIVSGVGFLGAGIIFVRNNNVITGLTTSAGIWGTAGVGMAIGSGLIFMGVSVTVIMLLLQTVMHKNNFLHKNEGNRYKLYLKMNEVLQDFPKIKLEIIKDNVLIENLNINKNGSSIDIEIDLLTFKTFDKVGLSERLLAYENVTSIEIE